MLEELKAYMGSDHSWSDEELTSALSAEQAAQARVCRIPEDGLPADLKEALFRRVAHTLALRSLPLGVTASFSEAAVATNRVGGTDAEVKRLEAPHRKVIVG